jgi:hypothetical protein
MGKMIIIRLPPEAEAVGAVEVEALGTFAFIIPPQFQTQAPKP